jgi:HD-like signal output (HDOD) protein
MSTAVECPFIAIAPRDVAGWMVSLQQRDLPVQASSTRAIAELAANEDAVDAHMLGETLGADPLMVLNVLRLVAQRRSSRSVTDAETMTAALVLLGIPPFFHAFSELATVEDRLGELPAALEGFHGVLGRAHRAAQFALAFAVHRLDHDAAVIHEAALLHDFAEMLLWLHAPALAMDIARRQQANTSLRSADVQRQVLNVTLAELQQALMRAWRLPELLIQISDDQASPSPQVRNVQLAIRLARHTARGWDNAALPDDYSDIASLLNMGIDPTIQLLREIDE